MKIILFLFSLCLIVLTACGQGGNGDTSNVNDPEPTALPTFKPTPNPSPPSTTDPPVIPSPTPSLTPTPTLLPTPPPSPTPTFNPPPQSSSFGAIRGSVITSTGSALNAVHVRAINVDDKNIQIGSFSGIDSGPNLNDGVFLIRGVPPGKYRILIERVNGRGNVSPSQFGSFVSSNAPSLIFPDEYYNGERESDNDDPNDFEEVTISPDQITNGIDFITND